MATFDEVRTVADTTYQRIWRDWYQSTPNAQPAHHDFQLSELSAGYSHSKNWIVNPIGEGNLDDRDILDADGWPIWKIQLVHEMLHEYQEKGVHTTSHPEV